MYEISLKNIINFFQTHILSFGDQLREFFHGFLILLQIQFIKKKYIEHVFLIHFWTNIWSEYNWIRPGIIVSNELINMGNLVHVIPLSSFEGKKVSRNDIVRELIDMHWLDQKSIVRTSHLQCISKKRLIKRIWKCSDWELDQIVCTVQKFYLQKNPSEGIFPVSEITNLWL